MLGAGALGQPRGMVWGGRREEGSGWGTHVYLWRIHFDIWQNRYNIVKFKNKIKLKKNKKEEKKKNTPANAGDVRDTSYIPGSGRSPGGGHGNPLSFLAWRIPWTEEPGGLQSIDSQSQARPKQFSTRTHIHTPL